MHLLILESEGLLIPITSVDHHSQHPRIKSAIKSCITPNLENINDTYSLNILAYTMNKAGQARELVYLLKKLDSLAIRESKRYIPHL